MPDYTQFAHRIHTVRSAWKRTAALQGLAIVLMESIGIFVLFVVFNYFYGTHTGLRMAGALAALGAVIYLFARHVAGPLFRKISDEQIALFIEEHNNEFEGSLLSAAEFGSGHRSGDAQEKVIEAIIAAAVSRAEKSNLLSIIDLRRLKKYGLAAVVLLVGYVGLNVLYPESLGRLAIRSLKLQPVQEAPPTPMQEIRERPITFELSEESPRLPEGSELQLEALLSRSPDSEVALHFRPLAESEDETAWRKLAMEPIDKFHGYRGVLADLNESFQYFVSAENYRSKTCEAEIYERLIIEGFEVSLQFPESYGLPQIKEVQSNGDVSGLEKSMATVRAMCNRPLVSGTITWDDGAKTKMQLVGKQGIAASASFTFRLLRSASYRIELDDIDGQTIAPDEDMFVVAKQDKAPTLEIVSPTAPAFITPIAEVAISALARDDFGLAKAELVFMYGSEEWNEARTPVSLPTPSSPPDGSEHEIPINVTLQLEDLTPRLLPGQAILYHLEIADKKGWKVVGKSNSVGIVDYESWTKIEVGGYEMETEPSNIPPFLPFFEVAWELHNQLDTLPAAQFKQQASEIHQSMLDEETGEMFAFAEPSGDYSPAENAAIRRLMPRIATGHQSLQKPNTETTIREWRIALLDLQTLGLLGDPMQGLDAPPVAATQKEQDMLKRQFEAFLAQATDMREMPPPGEGQKEESKMRRAAEQAEMLSEQQEALLEEAEAMAKESEQSEGEQQASSGQQESEQGEQTGEETTDSVEQGEQTSGEQTGERAAGEQSGEQTTEEGEQTIGDQASGEQTTGEQSGEQTGQQSGEQTAGEQGAQPNEQQSGEQTAQSGNPADPSAAERSGASDLQSAQSTNPQAQSLANKQNELAKDIKDMAGELESLGQQNTQADSAAQQLKDVAKFMAQAAQKFRHGDTKSGIQDAARASTQLQAVSDDLQGTDQTQIAEALANLINKTAQLGARQTELREQTESLSASATQQDREFLRKVFKQMKLKAEMQAVKGELEKIGTQAGENLAADTAKKINDAVRTLERKRIDQKMSDAIVDLKDQDARSAAKAQKKAAAGLEKVASDLRAASDTLAADFDSELSRALAEASRVEEALDRLSGKRQAKAGQQDERGKQAGEQTAEAGKPGEQTAEGGEEQGGEQSGEQTAGEQAGGEQTAEGGEQGEKPSEQGGKQTGGEQTAEGGEQQGEQTAEGGEQGGKPGEQTTEGGEQTGDEQAGEQTAGGEQTAEGGEQTGGEQTAEGGEEQGGEQTGGEQAGEQTAGGEQTAEGGEQTGGEQTAEGGEEQGNEQTGGEQGSEQTAGEQTAEAGNQGGEQTTSQQQSSDQTTGNQGTENTGEQAPTDPSDAERSGASDPQPSPATPALSRSARRQLAKDAAFEAQLLSQHLEHRQFADAQDREQLNQIAQDATGLGGKLETDEATRERLRQIVQSVKDRLEAERQSRIKAKRLFSAQREECPPQYRDLVNKYYESLSQTRK